MVIRVAAAIVITVLLVILCVFMFFVLHATFWTLFYCGEVTAGQQQHPSLSLLMLYPANDNKTNNNHAPFPTTADDYFIGSMHCFNLCIFSLFHSHRTSAQSCCIHYLKPYQILLQPRAFNHSQDWCDISTGYYNDLNLRGCIDDLARCVTLASCLTVSYSWNNHHWEILKILQWWWW